MIDESVGQIVSSLPSSHDPVFGFHVEKACAQCGAVSYWSHGAARRLCGHGIAAGRAVRAAVAVGWKFRSGRDMYLCK